jgi:hypothetical protein
VLFQQADDRAGRRMNSAEWGGHEN